MTSFPTRITYAAALVSMATQVSAVTLFREDFESVTLGPIVTFDSELRNPAAWTETPPPNWVVDDTGVPSFGQPTRGSKEFEGWSFVDRNWWVSTAGDQNRSQFTGGVGKVAVADPDEWDDFGDPDSLGDFDAKLRTPLISLTPAGSTPINVFFNSSWRQEGRQKASLTATFNDPAATVKQLLLYDSVASLGTAPNLTPNPAFKPDATNEVVSISLTGANAIPVGATAMTLEFRLFEARNNWWWAFDNIEVSTNAAPTAAGTLRAVVNRDTQQVSIVNDSGASVSLRGYSIVSTAGVLDEAAADFLAPAGNWLQATKTTDASNDLSEVNLTSANIANGSQIDFGPVWRPFYREGGDLRFEYLVAGNDQPVVGSVEFVGSSAPFEFLDLNFDRAIDILDWNTFRAGYGRSLAGLFESQRYALADLDNDGRHTVADFQIFRSTYDAVNGAGAFAAIMSVPEPAAIAMLVPAFALAVFRRRVAGALLAFCLLCGAATTGTAQTLLFEDFESVTLGPNVDEGTAGQVSQAWTRTPPTGWTIDNSGMPGFGNDLTDGVSEWAGWSFASKTFWLSADDQTRSRFTRGQGNIMVADPDEWDDNNEKLNPLPNPPDFYDTFAKTRTINIPSGIAAGRVKLSFDSSWRPEGFDDLNNLNNQTATIRAIYNPGSPSQSVVEVLRWDSNPDGEFFKADAQNERVTLDLAYNGSATSLQLEFGLGNAWNDWWWAIDNLLVNVPANPLKLRVNTFNGEAFLVGDDTIATSINFLSIQSPGGVLTGTQTAGLAAANLPRVDGPDSGSIAGDTPGEQWEPLVNAATATTQVDAAFLFGSSSLTNANNVRLGYLMNPTTPAGSRDIRFTYQTDSGDIVERAASTVEYFFDSAAGLAGDFNRDGTVNVADYTTWRDGLGTIYGQADYNAWVANYGRTAAATSTAVPEPASIGLVGFALAMFGGLRRGVRRAAAAAPLAMVVGVSAGALAKTDDRVYRFGDDAAEGAVVAAAPTGHVGRGNTGGTTFDSAGAPGQQQLIDLRPFGPTVAGSVRLPVYVTVNDRPDMLAGSNVVAPAGRGIAMNQFPAASPANAQYLATGYNEALNFPERSPSSTLSETAPAGTINYRRQNDRGFQLWTRPTRITANAEAHIVMDSNQHGVMINRNGQFAMRYAFDQQSINDLATAAGQPASAFANVFDYASGVTAQVNTWYHLAVVRPFGPDNGSILYVNGVARAAAKGRYNTETIVTDDNPMPDLTKLDRSPLVVGAATAAPVQGQPNFVSPGNYYSGVVDDLEMFVMGLNASRSFGEWVFETDNDFAAAFKPTTAGDLNNDGDITLADAQTFATNWLYEKRLSWTDFRGAAQSLRVGDLESRGRGDFNYDGIVDLRDWAVLNNASPSMATVAMQLIQAVPEPSSAVVALLGLAMAGWRRRG